jgi:hypothetical protein
VIVREDDSRVESAGLAELALGEVIGEIVDPGESGSKPIDLDRLGERAPHPDPAMRGFDFSGARIEDLFLKLEILFPPTGSL